MTRAWMPSAPRPGGHINVREEPAPRRRPAPRLTKMRWQRAMLLAWLARGGRVSMKQAGRELGIDLTTASEILRSLRDLGAVKCKTGFQDDRRAVTFWACADLGNTPKQKKAQSGSPQ